MNEPPDTVETAAVDVLIAFRPPLETDTRPISRIDENCACCNATGAVVTAPATIVTLSCEIGVKPAFVTSMR